MKIAMLGTGAYSLALSLMLSKKKENNIMLWTENQKVHDEFKRTKRLDTIFPDRVFPENIDITTSYEETIQDAELIFIACAAKFVDLVCGSIKPFYNKNIPICIASKGIEERTGSFLSDIVKNTLNADSIAVLSGPTFAIDMANNEPIALALASTNEYTAKIIKDNLAGDTLKLRETNDLIGIQICGSIKNVIAIASGIVKGLGYAESTLAFLINESLHDIKYLIDELGGDKKTVLSFAGVGDLLLTCTSTKSRNYSFGYIVGSTKDPEQIDEFLKTHTVEGYYTLSSIYKLVRTKHIDLPIINLIYDIIMNGKDPNLLAKFLIEKE
ncbi:MAG: NAD(P)H-dependent glycerol-3-phosphate dehydrogenase [Bacilli bacterium]|nr:NAD(P)H-dependent glycerol-3-phosphate dehydrogenase [Bacilli bacterium]